MAIELNPSIRDEIIRYCRAIVPEAKVFVFGSRATGAATPRSDLDLALLAPQALPLERIYQLKNTFMNSNIPHRIDVVDMNALDAGFRKLVEAEAVLLTEQS